MQIRTTYLSQIASPDTIGERATNLGVSSRGKDVGVASLTIVGPTLGHSGTDTIETSEVRSLAEPATDENLLKLVCATRRKNLSEGAGVELVNHLTISIDGCLESVGLESVALGERAHTQLASPFVDNSHVSAATAAG